MSDKEPHEHGGDRCSDPEQHLKVACGVMYFIAGLSLLLGVLGAAGVELVARMGIGVVAILLGLVFGGLAWAVQRFQSRFALGLAIGLFALDGILAIPAAVNGASAEVGSILVRAFFILALTGLVQQLRFGRTRGRRAGQDVRVAAAAVTCQQQRDRTVTHAVQMYACDCVAVLPSGK